ncbi:MAG: hypothetical protein HY290_04720 [Planctomycetia bacterium]|nr:hypothetical protein [Planctomycetia bacterium]
MLQEACGGDEELFQLQAGLLDIEREYRGMSRRAGIYEALEDRLRAGQYGGEEDGRVAGLLQRTQETMRQFLRLSTSRKIDRLSEFVTWCGEC